MASKPSEPSEYIILPSRISLWANQDENPIIIGADIYNNL